MNPFSYLLPSTTPRINRFLSDLVPVAIILLITRHSDQEKFKKKRSMHCKYLFHIFILRCRILSNFSHLFLVLNSSVNIIIYGWKDNKFREILIDIFHLNCILKQSSRSLMNRTPSAETQITRVDSIPVTVMDSLI